MNTNKQGIGIDPKVKLSLLWAFVLFNMAYADILSLMDPTSPICQRMAGDPMTRRILVDRRNSNGDGNCYGYPVWVLPYKANRWGKHHHRCNEYFVRCNWRTRSLLYIFCNSRSCVYVTNYLVCLEVETSSCAYYQLTFSGLQPAG